MIDVILSEDEFSTVMARAAQHRGYRVCDLQSNQHDLKFVWPGRLQVRVEGRIPHWRRAELEKPISTSINRSTSIQKGEMK